MVLDVSQLTMDFGGLRAVDHADIQINEGEIVALIGPNGAGKTTFFNCVTGVYRPTKGAVRIQRPGETGREVTGMKPNRVTEQGLARTFQNIRLFPQMTVLENVMVARHTRSRTGVFGAIFRPPAARHEEEEIVETSLSVLSKLGLVRYADEAASSLPYGAQRRLEIARAIATDPFLLLLDEPAAGMNPNETRDLEELIREIRETEKLTIFLIEHDMSLVMRVSERIYVMDYGRLIATGPPDEVKRNPDVIRAYLGEPADDA